MIKYIILVAGITAYFFSITFLIDKISNFSSIQGTKTSPDPSSDSWTKTTTVSSPPNKSKPSNPVKNMMEKKSPDNSDNSAEKSISMTSLKLSPPNKVTSLIISVLNAVEKCIGDVESLAHDSKIKVLNKQEVTEKFLDTFDINNDDEIRFSEYHISNQFLTKTPKNLRQIFRFFDKNHDWVISKKELEKSKPKTLHIFLVSGKRK